MPYFRVKRLFFKRTSFKIGEGTEFCFRATGRMVRVLRSFLFYFILFWIYRKIILTSRDRPTLSPVEVFVGRGLGPPLRWAERANSTRDGRGGAGVTGATHPRSRRGRRTRRHDVRDSGPSVWAEPTLGFAVGCTADRLGRRRPSRATPRREPRSTRSPPPGVWVGETRPDLVEANRSRKGGKVGPCGDVSVNNGDPFPFLIGFCSEL